MARRDQLPDVRRGSDVWRPLQQMSQLQRRIDRMFNEFLNAPLQETLGTTNLMEPISEFMPACDVEETDKHYLVSFDLPGVKKDEVKISLQDNVLTVSGERKREHKEERRGRWSEERYYGSFSRSFALPANVDSEKVEASYDNGVLHIAIPKTATATGKQIPIKEGKLIEAKPEKAA